MLRELRYYADRLEPCNIFDKNGLIQIYFHQVQSKACFVLKEFSQCADEFYIVESKLPDDETINYVVKFHKSRLEDIAFVEYCISKDVKIGGCALYNLPIIEYWLSIECDISPQVYVSEEIKVVTMPGRPGTKGDESHLVSFSYVAFFIFHLSLSVVFYT